MSEQEEAAQATERAFEQRLIDRLNEVLYGEPSEHFIDWDLYKAQHDRDATHD